MDQKQTEENTLKSISKEDHLKLEFSANQASGIVMEEEKKQSTSAVNVQTIGLLKFENNKDYNNAKIMSRWEEERAKWLKPPESTKKGGQKIVKANIEEGGTSLASFINKRDYQAEQLAKTFINDVRGDTQSRELPEEDSDEERRVVKKIMKSQSGPYQRFDAFYALEDVIDLYMEIWYDSDSSDN